MPEGKARVAQNGKVRQKGALSVRQLPAIDLDRERPGLVLHCGRGQSRGDVRGSHLCGDSHQANEEEENKWPLHRQGLLPWHGLAS